ncbi:hypothetical protein BHE74_00025752 [Ensete ventricosum]|nr:hypothetical protein BHE74_00025752 [Ensete ventricosum]
MLHLLPSSSRHKNVRPLSRRSTAHHIHLLHTHTREREREPSLRPLPCGLEHDVDITAAAAGGLRKRRLGDDGRGRLFEPAHAVACRYGEQLVTLHASLPSSNLSNVSASLKSRLTSRHAARGRCQSRRFWSRELNGGMQSGAVVVVVENCFVVGPKWASFYGWRNPPRGVGWLAGPHPQLVKRTLEVGRGTNLLPSGSGYGSATPNLQGAADHPRNDKPRKRNDGSSSRSPLPVILTAVASSQLLLLHDIYY